jgi:hypothetical protein
LKPIKNFVFATLAIAHFAYATLEFDNTSQMPFRGKSNNFSFHFCHSENFAFATEWQL